MNILSAVTGVAKYVASASVGAVVGNLIAIKTPSDIKPITKLSIGLGTFILSGVLSDMAMTYVETQITDISNGLVLAKTTIGETQEPVTTTE